LEEDKEVHVRVIIVGAGAIGRGLADNLTRRPDNEVVLIDNDKEQCERVGGQLDALVLHGDGTHPEILEKARVREADALVATTGSDALNAVIAMLGHHYAVGKIIVKLEELGLWPACQEIGVSEIIAPKVTAASRITSVLYGTSDLDLSLITQGGLQLVELPAGDTAGNRLSELELPEDAMIVAIVRSGRLHLARASVKIDEGDVLLTLYDGEPALSKVRKALGLSQAKQEE
jgi:trk/ktr system potassium uptake protein